MSEKYRTAVTAGLFVGSGIAVPASVLAMFVSVLRTQSLASVTLTFIVTFGAVTLSTVAVSLALAYKFDVSDLMEYLL